MSTSERLGNEVTRLVDILRGMPYKLLVILHSGAIGGVTDC
jgi:hypothetical protein